jgi:hypothetical protein
MAEIQNCPICQTPSEQSYDGRIIATCPRCGNFKIGRIASLSLNDLTISESANLSGWIRENQDCFLGREELLRLRQLRTPTVGEKATKLLLHLSKQNPKVSATIGIFNESFVGSVNGSLTDWDSKALSNHIRPEYLAWSWAVDFEELSFLLETYLENELGYLESSKNSVMVIFKLRRAVGPTLIHCVMETQIAKSALLQYGSMIQ